MCVARIQGDSEDDQTGQTKFVNPTNNRAAVRKSGLEFCAVLAATGAHYYSANSIERNTACRNHYRVAVIDAGNSDILRGMSEQTREREPRKFLFTNLSEPGVGAGDTTNGQLT